MLRLVTPLAIAYAATVLVASKRLDGNSLQCSQLLQLQAAGRQQWWQWQQSCEYFFRSQYCIDLFPHCLHNCMALYDFGEYLGASGLIIGGHPAKY